MPSFEIKYSEIVINYLDCNQDVNKLIDIFKTNNPSFTCADVKNIKNYLIQTFVPAFIVKWQQASRTKSFFYSRNEIWLQNVFIFESSRDEHDGPSCSKDLKRDRPFMEVNDLGPRAKKTREAALGITPEKNIEQFASFSLEKALSILLDACLSKSQYEVIRLACKEIGCDIFPPYYQVLKIKKTCYPSEIQTEEHLSMVSLQSLLNHTATRIIETKSKSEVFEMPNNLTLTAKWGCDGSSGHSEYKQAFIDQNKSDAHMFLTSLVPLTITKENDSSLICWTNPRPSSTRFCRPLKFEFVKETSDIIQKEVASIKNQIADLQKCDVNLNDKTFTVSFKLLFTMLDGKVASNVTHTSAMSVCFICKAKPTEMNRLDLIASKEISQDALALGMSPLHARIKFMECILHIAYNKSFKAWRTNSDTRQQKEDAKQDIQKRLKSVLGINVDVVKQGMGTTNDGNTSRRFFDNPTITANILGVNENIIHRFGVILDAINCNSPIDAEKFQSYCTETAKLYVDLYPWYYMPVTVHKILLHGGQIVETAVLPIGMLSEEALEARNKDCRRYRLCHSRKCGRIESNEDVMHHLLASSDPYINSFRRDPNKKNLNINEDVLDLLQ